MNRLIIFAFFGHLNWMQWTKLGKSLNCATSSSGLILSFRFKLNFCQPKLDIEDSASPGDEVVDFEDVQFSGLIMKFILVNLNIKTLRLKGFLQK